VSHVNIGFPVGGPYIQGVVNLRSFSTASISDSLIAFDLFTFDSSKVTLTNASLGRDLIARNGGGGSDAVVLQESTIGRDLTSFDSPITMTQGSVAGNVLYRGSGALSLNNTSIGHDLGFYGSDTTATMNVQNGSVSGNVTMATGLCTMSGTTVVGNFTSYTVNAVSVTGGMIGGTVDVTDDSLTSMSGTLISGPVIAEGASHVDLTNVSMKSLSHIATVSSATLKLTNCTVQENVLTLLGSSEFTDSTIGGDFNADGAAVVSLSGNAIGFDALVAGTTTTTMDGGGSIGRNLVASGSAQFSLKSGSVVGNVTAADASSVALTGGSVAGNVFADGGTSLVTLDGTAVAGGADATAGTINMMSQSVGGLLRASGSGRVVMSGGTVNVLGAIGGGTVRMTGGVVETDAGASENATMDLAGGKVSGDAFALGSAVLNLTGATVAGDVFASEQSTVVMSDGIARKNVNASGTASFTFTGGSIAGDVNTADDAQADISATVSGNLNVGGKSRVNITPAGTVQQNANVTGPAVLAVDGSVLADVRVDNETFDRFDVRIRGQVAANVLERGLGTLTIEKGGSVGGSVELHGFSEVAVDGGIVHGDVAGLEHGGVSIINGGQVDGNVDVFYLLQFRAGTVGGSVRVYHSDARGVALIGDKDFPTSLPHIVQNVETYVDGQAKLEVGTIGGDLTTRDDSVISMSGGTVVGNANAYDNSTIRLTGGTIDGFAAAHGHATIDYSGGTILGGVLPTPKPALSEELTPWLTSADPAPVPGLVAFDDGLINIYGTDLQATLIDSSYLGMFSLYELTGILTDGSTFGGQYFSVQNDTGATYQLLPPVPEPCLAFGWAAPLARVVLRRSRRRAV
jgi:hypothetical protein